MEYDLIIVRGCPGSGKNTFADLLDGYVCTADDYHMKDGKYDWKAENAGKAHFECQRKCENLMKISVSRIIIANTSTTEKELKPYYDLAKKYNYRVFSIIVENRHNGENIHSVPNETLEKMSERFQIKLI
jgi:predicted kinase